MELTQARTIAEKVKAHLAPVCERVEVAGSIRRCKPVPRDIDLVLIPANQGQLYYRLQELGQVKAGGQKLLRVLLKEDVQLDVYVATPETWATLLLIRTGSTRHNIKLCKRAQNGGMKLHADGTGLFRLEDCQGKESRVAGDTEESIFKALDLAYVPPENRG